MDAFPELTEDMLRELPKRLKETGRLDGLRAGIHSCLLLLHQGGCASTTPDATESEDTALIKSLKHVLSLLYSKNYGRTTKKRLIIKLSF